MSLPSSALAPVSGADWPNTTLVGVTPGALCAWAPSATAAAARPAAARIMKFGDFISSPVRRFCALVLVRAGGHQHRHEFARPVGGRQFAEPAVEFRAEHPPRRQVFRRGVG